LPLGSDDEATMIQADARSRTGARRVEPLFQPVRIGDLTLKNRIAMAPMTRAMSPDGVPREDVARYYRRRAEGGAGLIITEGTFIPHWSAGHDRNAPRLYGEEAIKGWRHVVQEVHAAGGTIFSQLWHVGLVRKPQVTGADGIYETDDSGEDRLGPSGVIGGNELPLAQVRPPATLTEIHDIIEAYGVAAKTAQDLGFDGIEVHGAHGYLIDQFLWSRTNLRNDQYGGDAAGRARFAVDVVREIRRRVGPSFPVTMRLSTWKQQDYTGKLAETPDEWADIVLPISNSGVDAFHISQRRYWEGEFGSDLNLAGWTKSITSKPTVTVGSVTLNNSVAEMMQGYGGAAVDNLDRLLSGLDRGEYDMVAIGRAMIANPDWVKRIRAGEPLKPYTVDMLNALI
jgi:2,4-dienoyl-CoA reductase-like NADH-dependent reductase (Old Yellow Enzyme family)